MCVINVIELDIVQQTDNAWAPAQSCRPQSFSSDVKAQKTLRFRGTFEGSTWTTTANPPLPCLRHAAESGRHHHKPNLHTYFPGERRWVKQSFATVWSCWTDKDTHKHFSHSFNESGQEQTAADEDDDDVKDLTLCWV